MMEKKTMGITETELRRMLGLSLNKSFELSAEVKRLRAHVVELEAEVAKGLSWEEDLRRMDAKLDELQGGWSREATLVLK